MKIKRKSKRSKSKRRIKNLKQIKLSANCNKSFTKKYISRPGPPYPAQDCKYHVKYGNNSILYQSRPDKNLRFRWVKM